MTLEPAIAHFGPKLSRGRTANKAECDIATAPAQPPTASFLPAGILARAAAKLRLSTRQHFSIVVISYSPHESRGAETCRTVCLGLAHRQYASIA